MHDDFFVGLTRTQKAVAAKCTPLEREFVMRWIALGCDASQAVKALKQALGASAKKLSKNALVKRVQRLQQKQSVNDLIDVIRQHSFHSAIMTKEEAKLRLTHKVRTTIDDVLEWSEYVAGVDDHDEPIYQTAWRIKNLGDMPDHVRTAIKSVSIDASGRPKIELYDSTASARLLAEISDWKSPTKNEHTGADGAPLGLEGKIDEPTLKALLAQSTQKILDAL